MQNCVVFKRWIFSKFVLITNYHFGFAKIHTQKYKFQYSAKKEQYLCHHRWWSTGCPTGSTRTSGRWSPCTSSSDARSPSRRSQMVSPGPSSAGTSSHFSYWQTHWHQQSVHHVQVNFSDVISAQSRKITFVCLLKGYKYFSREIYKSNSI